MTEKRVHAIVHGRVQGVFFREYTRRQAEYLGLNGWVKNLPDRTVEAVFEGSAPKVEEMITWLSTGSPQSDVTNVVMEEEVPLGDLPGFTIRY